MKKICSWLFIIAGTLVLVAGTSENLFKKIHEKKYFEYNTSWWGEHHSFGGDLVNMSYLDDIKKFQAPKDYEFRSPPDSNGMKNIDLYLWGDSYIEDVPATVFAHVNAFHFGRTYYQELHYTLDHSRKNILLIECAERFARPYFNYKTIYKSVSRETPKPAFNFHPDKAGKIDLALFGIPLGVNQLFNEHINQNLEFVLFNYNFLNTPRFLKADMNYLFFNRASGNVAISADGNNLFLQPTMLPVHGYSSYEPLPASAIDWYVQELNNVYDHYKADGFDEVYLSIIPNPVTILQPEKYNHFILLLNVSKSLRMPLIDVYDTFKNDPAPRRLYRPGDTHWNNNGIQIWLGKVNDELRKQSEK